MFSFFAAVVGVVLGLGTIVSFLFNSLFKRHIKKNGTILKESFIEIIPIILGSINTLFVLVFGIMLITAIFHHSSGEFLIAVPYYLILPFNMGAITLTLLLKENKYINRPRFLYCILTNVIPLVLTPLFFLAMIRSIAMSM